MIKIRSVALHGARLKTRMPFRYGIAVMTELPHVLVLAEVEIDSARTMGIAADHLPPKWFTKDPGRDPDDEIADMAAAIRQAARYGEGLRAASVFDAWQEIHDAQSEWGRRQGYPPLLHHFGTSLVERAVIDAFCRRHARPCHELLQANLFGIRLGELHSELRGGAPADWLPARPLQSVICRHTVGLSDPLEDGDEDASRDDSDLPRSLAASIRRYGLRHFKIKVASDSAESLHRLGRIAAILQRETRGDFMASLDGNESYGTVEAFRDFWARMRSREELEPLFSRLLFVEQPFHRDSALGEDVRRGLRAWKEAPPLIIDESDAEIESLPRALACGYAGTSHKNCKGVFHGVASACLLAKRRSESGSGFLMSGEDLANIGPVALLQDLAVQAALGNASVERNGHHYFQGLSFWPSAIQRQMLDEHPDLYRTTAAGWPTLAIEKGRISLESINRAPFGVASIPAAVAELPRLDALGAKAGVI